MSDEDFNKSLSFLSKQSSYECEASTYIREAIIFQHRMTKNTCRKEEELLRDIGFALAKVGFPTLEFKDQFIYHKNDICFYKNFNKAYKYYINQMKRYKKYLKEILSKFESFYKTKVVNDNIILEREFNNEPLVFVLPYYKIIKYANEIINNEISFPENWSNF